MEFLWKTVGGNRCLCVDTWYERGLFHGFFTAEMPKNLSSLEVSSSKVVPISLLKQVHGTNIYPISSSITLSPISADGWIGNLEFKKPILVGIKTADCIPVLLYSNSHNFFAALHCGWRGSVAGILISALKAFLKYGESPQRVEIALGPGASRECYEIGEDMVLNLNIEAKTNPHIFPETIIKKDEKYYFDIKVLLCKQAIEYGVPKDNIVVSNICTICSSRFHSYRRDAKNAGRNLTLIGTHLLGPIKGNQRFC